LRKIQRLAAVGAIAALTAVLGACSSAQTPANPPAAAPADQPAATSEAAAPSGTGVTQVSEMFGPACSQMPATGEGSPQGMVDEPVATAASHNPLLTTLAKAVTATKLADTLNSAESLTVFAPYDDAFKALDAKAPGTVTKLTTDPNAASPDSQLAKILKYHVVGKRYDAAGIVQQGTLPTLGGGTLTIGGTALAPTVNGAKVLCGNIPTKNATVFVIDTVLTPPAT
jgi:uncharacterized surface protein with fasciclin (FAS1) repeats